MCIGTIKVLGKTFAIRITNHGRKRMQEREVKDIDIINAISGIDEKRLEKLRRTEREIVIIDSKNQIAIVLGFEEKKNQLVIVTVFNNNHYTAYKETTKIAV